MKNHNALNLRLQTGFIVGVAMVLASMLVATPAEAAQSPAGCSADNSQVNISGVPTVATTGTIITFTVSAGNPTSANGCDITGRTMTLTLPNGVQHVFGPFNYPNGTAVADVGSAQYTADNADLSGSFWTANVVWNGTLKGVSDLPSTGSKNASVLRVLPLEVTKTASGTFDRNWTWQINKTVDDSELLLAESETATVNYTVSVTPTSHNVNTHVEGTITITNPVGNPDATIDSLADIVDKLDSNAEMAVDCEAAGFPVVLGGGDTLNCTYAGDGAGDEQDNTVTVTTSGAVPGNSDTVAINWATDPSNETNECVDVSDDKAGPLGTVCANDVIKTFHYSTSFGPEGTIPTACDENYNYVNTATATPNDGGPVVDDDATVHVVVNCQVGCTLTQGYWKTHNDSFHGGAPTDDTWALLGLSAENTTFFLSGQSWYTVFWTAPKGNVYYNLAHQYMAAKLNILAGATAPANVTIAISQAETLFASKTPAQAGALKGAAKNTWNSLAGILGSYNEGSIGPGHCDEQNP